MTTEQIRIEIPLQQPAEQLLLPSVGSCFFTLLFRVCRDILEEGCDWSSAAGLLYAKAVSAVADIISFVDVHDKQGVRCFRRELRQCWAILWSSLHASYSSDEVRADAARGLQPILRCLAGGELQLVISPSSWSRSSSLAVAVQAVCEPLKHQPAASVCIKIAAQALSMLFGESTGQRAAKLPASDDIGGEATAQAIAVAVCESGDAALLSCLAAAASRDSSIASWTAKSGLLPMLLGHFACTRPSGVHPSGANGCMALGISSVLSAYPDGRGAEVALPFAVAAARAAVSLIQSAAMSALSPQLPDDATFAASCPRACSDSVLVAAQLLAAASRARKATAAATPSHTSGMLESSGAHAGTSGMLESSGAHAGTSGAGAFHVLAQHEASASVGSKRARPVGDSSAASDAAAACVAGGAGPGGAAATSASASAAAMPQKRQLLQVDGELHIYGQRGVAGSFDDSIASEASPSASGSFAAGLPRSASEAVQAAECFAASPLSSARSLPVGASAVRAALAGCFDALVVYYLQHGGVQAGSERRPAAAQLGHWYACAGGNALSFGADSPATVTSAHLAGACELIVGLADWAGSDDPGFSSVALTDSRSHGAVEAADAATKAVRVSFAAVISRAAAAARAAPPSNGVGGHSDTGAGAGAGAGCSAGGAGAGAARVSGAEAMDRPLVMTPAPLLMRHLRKLLLPSDSAHAGGLAVPPVSASEGAPTAELADASMLAAADCPEARSDEGNRRLGVAAAWAMGCVLIEFLLTDSPASCAAAVAGGAGELLQQAAAALPPSLLSFAASAMSALLRSVTLATKPSAALAASGSKDAIHALTTAACRLRVYDADGSAVCVPYLASCAAAAALTAQALQFAAVNFADAATVTLADGVVVAALLRVAGFASRSRVLAAVDAEAAALLPMACQTGYFEWWELSDDVEQHGKAAAGNFVDPLSSHWSDAADAVLSLAAAAWPLLSATGRARIDAVLGDERVTAIMMRHASSEAALRFHLALCCDATDPAAAAARLKRAVTHWGLMHVLAACIAADARSTDMRLDAASLSRDIICDSPTASASAASSSATRAAAALKLLHAALVPASGSAAGSSRALQYHSAPASVSVQGFAASAWQFRKEARRAADAVAAAVHRKHAAAAASEGEPLRCSGAEWKDEAACRKARSEADAAAMRHSIFSSAREPKPAPRPRAWCFEEAAESSGSKWSDDDDVDDDADPADPAAWYCRMWRVMHDDERDVAAITTQQNSLQGQIVGVSPLIQLVADAAICCVHEHANSGLTAAIFELGGEALAMLNSTLRNWHISVAAMTAASTAVLARPHCPKIALTFLPAMAAAAGWAAWVSEPSGGGNPLIVSTGAAAACSAVLAHGSSERGSVKLAAGLFAALLPAGGAASPAHRKRLGWLLSESPLRNLLAAARSFLSDANLTSQAAAIVQYLTVAPAECRHEAMALLLQVEPVAAEWLADALYAAESDFDPAAPLQAPQQAGGAPALLGQLVGAAKALAEGPLAADLVARGVAGSLMRLVPLLAGHPAHAAMRAEAQQALVLLRAEPPGAPVRVAHAHTLRLALAARASTWRRRRHAVAARMTEP